MRAKRQFSGIFAMNYKMLLTITLTPPVRRFSAAGLSVLDHV